MAAMWDATRVDIDWIFGQVPPPSLATLSVIIRTFCILVDVDIVTMFRTTAWHSFDSCPKNSMNRNSANGFAIGWPEDSRASKRCAHKSARQRMWLHEGRRKESCREAIVNGERKGVAKRVLGLPIAAEKVDPGRVCAWEELVGWDGCRLYDVFWCDSTARYEKRWSGNELESASFLSAFHSTIMERTQERVFRMRNIFVKCCVVNRLNSSRFADRRLQLHLCDLYTISL